MSQDNESNGRLYLRELSSPADLECGLFAFMQSMHRFVVCLQLLPRPFQV
jgi:hypothetical protein